ncbi:MAG: SufD family Fe-S cluster assembly protein [Candidatus Kerfeldbacteria bacterium]|nr:SufD family Fe-S cluster assembly protein [Candidatus Kerfeldbacteria bacterium]
MNKRQTITDTLIEPSERVTVEAGQKITYIVPILGSVAEPRQREIVLAGEGAEAEIIGLFLGHGDDVLNLKLDTTHAAPRTRGRTEFRAVLADRAQLEFNGMIKILKGAQGSNDFLQQDSLLLSSDAKANAVPGLEIEANEVKASHGATAKPVDPEQKFYLMSRGLSEEQAERMIVQGFLSMLIKKIDDRGWRDKIQKSVREKFLLKEG